MRRPTWVLMAGALLLGGASEAEAQRANRRSERAREGRVERLEPVRAPGRVVAQPRVVRNVAFHRRGPSRVVYSTRRPGPGYAAHVSWVRADWARAVRFGPVAYAGHRAFLRGNELRALLGRRTVRHIRAAGHSVGLRGALRGHWVRHAYESILVVTMGGTDIAELIDVNGDGFVDEAWLIGPRGYRPVALGW